MILKYIIVCIAVTVKLENMNNFLNTLICVAFILNTMNLVPISAKTPSGQTYLLAMHNQNMNELMAKYVILLEGNEVIKH